MAVPVSRWSRTTPLQRAAVAVALLNVILLFLFQFLLTEGRGAPLPLYLLFTAIWLFGAVMLVVAPRFGAAGTALWGFIAAIGAWRTHAALDAANLAVIAGSLGGAVTALVFLVQLFQRDHARAE